MASIMLLSGLIMDRCVLLTSTPEWVVSPQGETTHSGVDQQHTPIHDRSLKSTAPIDLVGVCVGHNLKMIP